MKGEILRMNHVIYADEYGQYLLHDLNMQVFQGDIYGILNLERHGDKELIDLIEWNKPIKSGQVYFQDQLVNSLDNSNHSRNKVAVISAKSRLIDSLSLADNIFIIRPGFKKFYIHEGTLINQTQLLLNQYNVNLSPTMFAGELNTYQRLVAELLRAVVAGESLILLLDLPDLLGSEELAEFHQLMKRLVATGTTFIYIYNHHEALQNICDRIAIFHGMRIAKVIEKNESVQNHVKVFAQYTNEEMAQLMSPPNIQPNDNKFVLRFKQVNEGKLKNFSMVLPQGEIVLLIDRNNMILNDLINVFLQINQRQDVIGVNSYKPLKSLQIGIVQRAPIRETLFEDLSFIDNLCFSLGEKVPGFWRRKRYKKSVLREHEKKFGSVLKEKQLYDLDTQELYSLIYNRFLLAKPDLVVCYQPLSGQDMYLRPHILKLITRLRDAKISVLILSTDYYDTVNIADKIFWIGDGKITAEMSRDEFKDMIQD